MFDQCGTQKLERIVFARRTLRDLVGVPEDKWEPEKHVRQIHSVFPNLSVSGVVGDEDILVPARALAELKRLIGSNTEGTIGIHTTDSEITFQVGDVAISTRLISGTWPFMALAYVVSVRQAR